MEAERQRTAAVVRWASGVVIPLVLLGLGLWTVVNGVSPFNFGAFHSRQVSPAWGLEGAAAVANGASLIALGVGMHLHFWKHRLRGREWRGRRRALGRVATALIIGAVVLFFVSQLLPGRVAVR